MHSVIAYLGRSIRTIGCNLILPTALAASASLGWVGAATAQTPVIPFIDEPTGLAIVRYPDSPGWSYFRTSSYCYVTLQNNSGRLLVGYNRLRNEMHLGFWGRAAAGYADHEKTTVDALLFDLLPNGDLTPARDDWGPQLALVRNNATGNRVFNLKLNGRQALTWLGRHAALGINGKNGELLQAFRLIGSAVALRRLGTCDPR